MPGASIERDSRKDEAVVFIFIFATAGLLLYAAVQPWVERWGEVGAACGEKNSEGARADKEAWQAARERRSYIPVSNQADQ